MIEADIIRHICEKDKIHRSGWDKDFALILHKKDCLQTAASSSSSVDESQNLCEELELMIAQHQEMVAL